MAGRQPFDPDAVLRRIKGEGGYFPMRIDAQGGWHYQGSPIERPVLCKLFSKVLHRDVDGAYWLVTPVEQGRIEVEDVPFTAVEMHVEGEGRNQLLRFRTNLGEWCEAGPDNPLVMRSSLVAEGLAPYLRVRGRLEARLLRPVFYELVEHAVPDGRLGELGVWSRGGFFWLGSVHD